MLRLVTSLISNVISVNQLFASTFLMQIFKFFYLPGELARRLLWELIQAMNSHVHITINSWWWEWNGIRWWIKPIKSNFIQNIAKVCIRNHSIIPRDTRRQIKKAILQEGFDTFYIMFIMAIVESVKNKQGCTLWGWLSWDHCTFLENCPPTPPLS